MADQLKACQALGGLFFIISVTVIRDALGAGLNCCRIRKNSTHVDCDKCQLTSLPVPLMHENVTFLKVSDNDISTIPDGSFENMTSLRTLLLQGNPLQGLRKETFRGKRQIK